MTDEWAFGEENISQGETEVSWSTWSDGDGGTPTIVGDADWGKVELAPGKEARSLVYDMGDSLERIYTLEENRYGTGFGNAILQIRGDTSSFNRDDALPVWESYVSPMTRTWRYVQIRETTDTLLLGKSSNGRYLETEVGDPFLMIGDSPQGMMACLTPAQFDPTDGSCTADAASPHVNSGTHNFSHAGTNSAGAADWVLVLEV